MKVVWNTLIVMATVFAVFLGISIYGDYVQRSRMTEMRTAESRKAALPSAEAIADYQSRHGYDDKEARERAYRLRDAVKEDEANARRIEAANARIAEEARREVAKQQAAAKAIADAPRLRAEAEEAKRRAAVRAIEEKYSRPPR